MSQEIQKVQKPKKAPWTMVMQVANAHAFSIGFVGIQLTHGYVAALVLSSASVIVGMVVSLLTRFNGQLAPAIAFGVPLGGIVAFVFDSMTLFGLKMVHVSTGAKKWFAFLLIGLGIGLSTMAGDQMWQIIYADWHGIVLAMSVSCVIVMMDVWHEEHEKAVKRASQQPDAMQTALNTEVEVVVDKKLRQYTHEQLNSPEMEQDLREQSRQSVQQIVKAKFNKRLQQFAGEGGTTGQIRSIQEELDRPALPGPQSEQRALPAPSNETAELTTEEGQDGQEQHQPEQAEQTGQVVEYKQYRGRLIEMLENGGISSVTRIAEQAGIPRSTMGRWIKKATQELERIRDEQTAIDEQDDDDQDAHIIDMSSKRASHSDDETASERLTFERKNSKQASHIEGDEQEWAEDEQAFENMPSLDEINERIRNVGDAH
jgi:hypothetical protein